MIHSTLLTHVCGSLGLKYLSQVISIPHMVRMLKSVPVLSLAGVAYQELLCICKCLLATRTLHVGIVLRTTRS
jgi:hypothetical protein